MIIYINPGLGLVKSPNGWYTVYKLFYHLGLKKWVWSEVDEVNSISEAYLLNYKKYQLIPINIIDELEDLI